MDNLEIGQWPPNVSHVSLLLFVALIHMLISGAGIKMFYLGRGGGGRGVQNYFLTNAHLPLLHSRLRAEKKEKARGGREDKQTYKIINQFGSKSDSGIAVILQ